MSLGYNIFIRTRENEKKMLISNHHKTKTASKATKTIALILFSLLPHYVNAIIAYAATIFEFQNKKKNTPRR